MTAAYRKKLIEVALPLAAINAESAREKSIRHGHPSTLHLWWARRPLAACRAVLFASLVDDPDSDPQYRRPDGSVDEEAAGVKRADLFNLIEELVCWENSNEPDVIRTARAEIARCVASRLIETGKLQKDTVIAGNTTAGDLVKRGHCRPRPMGLDKKKGRVRFSFDVSRLPPAEAVNAFLAEHAPPVLDPFAGGGSIPLEAQRLGLRAYASDLNPVPVLINKALIEIPPKFAGHPPVNPEAHGAGTNGKAKGKKGKALVEKEWPGATGLAEDVRYYGKWMRDEAEKRVGHLYPKIKVTKEMAKDRPDLKSYIGEAFTIIASIWSRTVSSPNPVFRGAKVPLIGSYWLSQRRGSEAWLEPIIDSSARHYSFQIRRGTPTDADRTQIAAGTKIGRGCKFKCILSSEPIPEEHVKAEGMKGSLGATLLAVVADGGRERLFFPASVVSSDYESAHVRMELGAVEASIADDKRAIWCLLYGLDHFDKLFTRRQLITLSTFSDLVAEVQDQVLNDCNKCDASDSRAYASAVATYLAFALDRVVERHSAICTWDSSPSKLQLRGTFARQGIPMTWDYAEGNPFSTSSGTWSNSVEWVAQALENLVVGPPGRVTQVDATAESGPNEALVISTDPPYYDNIGYADLRGYPKSPCVRKLCGAWSLELHTNHRKEDRWHARLIRPM